MASKGRRAGGGGSKRERERERERDRLARESPKAGEGREKKKKHAVGGLTSPPLGVSCAQKNRLAVKPNTENALRSAAKLK